MITLDAWTEKENFYQLHQDEETKQICAIRNNRTILEYEMMPDRDTVLTDFDAYDELAEMQKEIDAEMQKRIDRGGQ